MTEWGRPNDHPAEGAAERVLCPHCKSSAGTVRRGDAQVVSTLRRYRLWYCNPCGKHILSEIL